MLQRILFLCVILFASSVAAGDPYENPQVVEAARVFFENVDKTKAAYINELENDLLSAQKIGNLKSYLDIDAERTHTLQSQGLRLSDYAPVGKTALNAKVLLKRTIESESERYKKSLREIAADLLKSDRTDDAKDFEPALKADFPPRYTLTREPLVEVKRSELPEPKYTPAEDLPFAKLVRKFSPRNGSCYGAAWINETVVTVGEDHIAALWNPETGNEILVLNRTKDIRGNRIALTPQADSKFNVLYGTNNGYVIYWNPETKNVLWKHLVGSEVGAIEHIAVDSTGERAGTCCKTGILFGI